MEQRLRNFIESNSTNIGNMVKQLKQNIDLYNYLVDKYNYSNISLSAYLFMNNISVLFNHWSS